MKRLIAVLMLAVALVSLTACTTDDIRGALDIIDDYNEDGEITLDEDSEFIQKLEEYVKEKIPNLDEMEEMVDDLNKDVDKALENSGYK